MEPATINLQKSQVQAWTVFGLRLVLGGVFLAAGVLKIGSPNELAATIAAFRILPTMFVAPLAIFLPLFEIGLGLYLITGLFARIAAMIAFAEMIIFAIAIASVVIRGITVSCGCFGPADTAPATWVDVVRDVVFACLALPIILWPSGRLSLDERMKQG
jgi:uncharacterized membrane protein YphA (DoxX/SURF4 family)